MSPLKSMNPRWNKHEFFNKNSNNLNQTSFQVCSKNYLHSKNVFISFEWAFSFFIRIDSISIISSHQTHTSPTAKKQFQRERKKISFKHFVRVDGKKLFRQESQFAVVARSRRILVWLHFHSKSFFFCKALNHLKSCSLNEPFRSHYSNANQLFTCSSLSNSSNDEIPLRTCFCRDLQMKVIENR